MTRDVPTADTGTLPPEAMKAIKKWQSALRRRKVAAKALAAAEAEVAVTTDCVNAILLAIHREARA